MEVNQNDQAETAPITSTTPCPRCGGRLTVRRDKTAHRKRFCCDDCDYSEPLPLSLKLREAGWKELPLFQESETP